MFPMSHVHRFDRRRSFSKILLSKSIGSSGCPSGRSATYPEFLIQPPLWFYLDRSLCMYGAQLRYHIMHGKDVWALGVLLPQRWHFRAGSNSSCGVCKSREGLTYLTCVPVVCHLAIYNRNKLICRHILESGGPVVASSRLASHFRSDCSRPLYGIPARPPNACVYLRMPPSYSP